MQANQLHFSQQKNVKHHCSWERPAEDEPTNQHYLSTCRPPGVRTRPATKPRPLESISGLMTEGQPRSSASHSRNDNDLVATIRCAPCSSTRTLAAIQPTPRTQQYIQEELEAPTSLSFITLGTSRHGFWMTRRHPFWRGLIPPRIALGLPTATLPSLWHTPPPLPPHLVPTVLSLGSTCSGRHFFASTILSSFLRPVTTLPCYHLAVSIRRS